MKTLSNSERANPTTSPSRLSDVIHTTRRRAIGLGATVVALVIIVFAVVVIFAYFPPSPGSQIKVPGQTTTTTSALSGNVPGKIQFVLTNPLSGASASPSSFKVYPAAGSQVGGQTYGGVTPSETITISSGTGTSALFYAPNTVLQVYGLLSGSNTEYWKVTAPGVTPAMQAQGTAAQLALPQPVNPTVALTMTDDKGNSITSSTTKENFTSSGHCPANSNCLGESSVTFTLTITNTAANTGYLSSYDPINAQNWCAAVQGKEGGSNVNLISVSGFPSSAGAFTVGSTRYWQSTIPDGLNVAASNVIVPGFFSNSFCGSYSSANGGISTQTQGSTNVGGTVTLRFTASKASLAAGNSLTITFQTYEYFDPVYASQNAANGGATAATLGSTFVLTIAA